MTKLLSTAEVSQQVTEQGNPRGISMLANFCFNIPFNSQPDQNTEIGAFLGKAYNRIGGHFALPLYQCPKIGTH